MGRRLCPAFRNILWDFFWDFIVILILETPQPNSLEVEVVFAKAAWLLHQNPLPSPLLRLTAFWGPSKGHHCHDLEGRCPQILWCPEKKRKSNQRLRHSQWGQNWFWFYFLLVFLHSQIWPLCGQFTGSFAMGGPSKGHHCYDLEGRCPQILWCPGKR